MTNTTYDLEGTNRLWIRSEDTGRERPVEWHKISFEEFLSEIIADDLEDMEAAEAARFYEDIKLFGNKGYAWRVIDADSTVIVKDSADAIDWAYSRDA